MYNAKNSNKDLHVSFRINHDMLKFHERLMEEISEKVGTRVPQSRVMRAMIAVTRDPDFREEFVGRIASYLRDGLNNW